jgi:hypothetical protein
MNNKVNLQDDLSQKSKEPKDKVLELIEWIEENQSEIFKTYDGLSGVSLLVIGFFFVVAYTAGAFIHDYAVSITIILATLTALIAYFSLIVQTSKEGILEKRLNRAGQLKKFSDTEKVLLKALIKIKSPNEEINLKTLYSMDKEANADTFTEKNLIGTLCK